MCVCECFVPSSDPAAPLPPLPPQFQVPTWGLLVKTWTEAGINQLVTGPVVAFYVYPIFTYFGLTSLVAPIPAFLPMAKSFLIASVFNEVGFYFTHRLVHSPMLYAKIHKQHHTYSGTIGFAAEYAHPIEQIFSNQLPTIGGILFFGAHPLVFYVWLFTRLQQTYEGHSGYCFYDTWLYKLGLTNADNAAYHDFHHSGNRGNFGALYLDWAFGTYDAWVDMGGTPGYLEQSRLLREKQGTQAGGGAAVGKMEIPDEGDDEGDALPSDSTQPRRRSKRLSAKKNA